MAANQNSVSFLAGFGLLLTAFVCAYLNTTTSAFIWSTIYMVATGICSIAAAAKFATAIGADSKVLLAADYIASVVPWVAIFFNFVAFTHYKQDGLAGFMGAVSLISMVFVVFFGVTDSIRSLVGAKFKAAADMGVEMQRRAQAMSRAAHGL
jgi:ABC-type uncharacterized transport system permease subunit